MLQSAGGYLGLALVFLWDGAMQGGFNCFFFMGFLLVLGEFSFLRGGWALGYDSMEFRHFCYIP